MIYERRTCMSVTLITFKRPYTHLFRCVNTMLCTHHSRACHIKFFFPEYIHTRMHVWFSHSRNFHDIRITRIFFSKKQHRSFRMFLWLAVFLVYYMCSRENTRIFILHSSNSHDKFNAQLFHRHAHASPHKKYEGTCSPQISKHARTQNGNERVYCCKLSKHTDCYAMLRQSEHARADSHLYRCRYPSFRYASAACVSHFVGCHGSSRCS